MTGDLMDTGTYAIHVFGIKEQKMLTHQTILSYQSFLRYDFYCLRKSKHDPNNRHLVRRLHMDMDGMSRAE